MNLTNDITTNNNKMNITLVSLLFIAFAILWQCYYGENILEVHYIGYSVLFAVTLGTLMSKNGNMTLIIPQACSRLIWALLYYAASFLWAIESNTALTYTFSMFVFVLLTLIMVNYFVGLGDIRILHLTIALMGIAMAIVVITKEGGFSAFYESATKSSELEMRQGVRVGSEILNANTIGMTCGYAAIVMFFYALFRRKKYCYFLMIIPAMVLMASASRKAILLLAFGILLVIYFKMKNEKNIQKYLKILFGILFAIVVIRFIMSLDIMYTVSNRIGSSLNMFNNDTGARADNSSSLRYEMIINGWKQFLYKPFMGIGMGNTRILYKVKLNFTTYAHNDYIEHLVNGGIIGFVIYYSVFYYLIKGYLRLMKIDTDPNLVISFILIILFLVMNMAMVSYYGSFNTYLFFILWISQLEIKKKQYRESDVEEFSDGNIHK